MLYSVYRGLELKTITLSNGLKTNEQNHDDVMPIEG